MESIEAKGHRLAAAGRVRIDTWTDQLVIADVGGDHRSYRVTMSADGAFRGCECPSTTTCSHIEAVRIVIANQIEEEELPMNEDPTRPFEDDESHDNGPYEPGVGPEPENYTDVVPEPDCDDEPPETVHRETGEILPAETGSVDAALLPLSDTPVTYQTLRAISRTEFVPAALRGKPEAVLACVLFGRELGLGPMQSLADIDVIDGRPSPSAELLGRLIRDAGHSIEVVEASATECRLRGTRGDTGETLETGFTIADAERVTTKERGQRIRLSETKRWREYPGDMLWARTISRLHRRLFPDVTALSTTDARPQLLDRESPGLVPTRRDRSQP